MFAPSGHHEEAHTMTHEELLAHQLDLHQKIQQQMQLQMEMSLQFSQRQSLTASLAKVEPDLGDNVFDMLDDLIMIPSGAVAPERNSLSKQALDVNDDSAGGRDSLADILESLDMDLDDFGDDGRYTDSTRSFSSSSSTTMDANRDSYDDDDLDLDDLDDDLDLNGDVDDHGVDDDDDTGDSDKADTRLSDPDAHAVPDEEDFVHLRRSSLDMLASVVGSSSSVSLSGNGNLCTLVWEGGLLGLRLRMSQSRMLPAVSKVTGKSSIVGIHLVEVGDLVIQIGSRMTKDMEFIEAINYLKEVEKPCKLIFRRSHADPMAVKPIQPQVKSAIGLKLAKKFEELTNAENEKFPAAPAVKLDAKYEVKWLDGPLGISLIASKDVPYPLVTRITGKNRSPQVQDVQPGHYLVQIGNYNTADGNFNTAIKFLQKVTKPVSLFFCPGNKKVSLRPEPTADEYDHVWEKKQALCFTVRPNDQGRMIVADLGSAKSIKVKVKGAPNVGASINSGDQILWINDDNTEELTFHEALLKLRTAKRPLVIRFRKAPPETPAEQRLPPPPPVTNPEVSPSTTATKSVSHGFNPLRKITSLSPYSKEKENASSTANARGNDVKKGSQSPPDVHQAKKSVLRQSDLEVKKSNQDPNHSQSAKVTSSISGTVSTKEASASENTENGTNATESRRATDSQAKILNLDVLNSFRKAPLQKASSDPVVTDKEKALASSTSLKPLSRGSANPAAQHTHDSHSTTSDRNIPPSSSKSLEDEGDVYEVVWPEGTALGLTLKVHPTTRFPVVARVTGTSNLKNIEHVSPGDILFAANNANIIPQPKFKQTLENLSKLPKPAVLRFRRAPSVTTAPPPQVLNNDHALPRGPPMKEHEYELIWRENANLGLVFSSDGDVPKVTKVDIESGGPMLHKVTVGDTLSCIGPLGISGSSFHTSMATLRAIKRPVVLRFQRRSHG